MPRRGPATLSIEFRPPINPTNRAERIRNLASAFAVLVELRREWEERKRSEELGRVSPTIQISSGETTENHFENGHDSERNPDEQ